MKKRLGSIELPYFNNIVNYAFDSFDKIKDLIDNLNPKEREWEKVSILINSEQYINFLAKVTDEKEINIIKYLNDFYNDKEFRKIWEDTLDLFQNKYSDNAGDVRFNSLSLYVIVRALKPDVFFETGVAAGKSSAIILLAMKHNKKGYLYSFDLPNYEGVKLADGSYTSTKDKSVGWLVPDYLREKWTLTLGNSVEEMPKVLEKLNKKVDIFFHDSLHTFEHSKKEINIIYPEMSDKGLILFDDLDMECGLAFSEFLSEKSLIAYAYRELGGVNLNQQ